MVKAMRENEKKKQSKKLRNKTVKTLYQISEV